MITELGKVLWANALGDATNGYTSTVSTHSATELKKAAAGWTAHQFKGQDVYTGASVGTILDNTTEVLTVARWENIGSTRGGAVGAEPVNTAAFSIASGATPAAWIAVSADTEAVKASNTTLKGELGSPKEEEANYGLVRKLAVFKYIGTNEYEIKVTFTAKAKDTVPVTLAKIGIFNAQNGGVMMFESLLTATAAIAASGDAVTITDVVSGS
jgi:hypothetical protein